MNNRDKSALFLALAIVGGIAAGMRCDASVTVETSSQYTPRSVAYTVKAYTEGSFFYCVSSHVLFCSKESENSDSPFLAAKQVLVGAPNFGLSFECGQDGISRKVMLRYNGIVIDVDTLGDE